MEARKSEEDPKIGKGMFMCVHVCMYVHTCVCSCVGMHAKSTQNLAARVNETMDYI